MMQTKGKLLIVDDESTFLKILNLMFSKYYEVRTAENGADALEILNSGYKPEVILSDQRMSGMSGAEFLEKTMKIVPNAVRIILTGYSTPKDIIPAINQAHAYMYLIKPADELALIQALKVAFDHYNNNRKVKQNVSELKRAIDQLKEKNDELKRLMIENTDLLNQSVQAISGVANYCERFYFSNHTKFVAVTSKLLAEDMGLAKERVSNIVIASLLHTALMNGLPIRFLLNDPSELANDEEKEEYKIYFFKSLETITKVKKLKTYSDIISKLWEHHDGSGFPLGLSGNQLSHESQIISIVNFYHNNVYRLSNEDVEVFLNNGEIIQTAKTTKKRHDECIKLMYRHATWFDYDLFHHFHDILKKKNIPTLVPEQNDLKITNPDKFIAQMLADKEKIKKIEMEKEEAESDEVVTVAQSTGKKMIEKEFNVSQLQPGMMMGQTVLTKSNMLVVKNESTLDAATIKNLIQLASTGMVQETVTVLLPKD